MKRKLEPSSSVQKLIPRRGFWHGCLMNDQSVGVKHSAENHSGCKAQEGHWVLMTRRPKVNFFAASVAISPYCHIHANPKILNSPPCALWTYAHVIRDILRDLWSLTFSLFFFPLLGSALAGNTNDFIVQQPS